MLRKWRCFVFVSICRLVLGRKHGKYDPCDSSLRACAATQFLSIERNLNYVSAMKREHYTVLKLLKNCVSLILMMAECSYGNVSSAFAAKKILTHEFQHSYCISD